MKKYIQFPSEEGSYINKFGIRMSVAEFTDSFIWWNGFNPRIHRCSAENLEGAIVHFGLKPYVDLPALSIGECIAKAERHITASFGPLIVSDGLKKIFTHQQAGTLSLIPKTIAVATWIETVKAMALAGSTAFPPAPYTVEDVLKE